MRIWVVEYTFKHGGPSGLRGSKRSRPLAFDKQEDAQVEVERATRMHGDTTVYRAVAYVPEESK